MWSRFCCHSLFCDQPQESHYLFFAETFTKSSCYHLEFSWCFPFALLLPISWPSFESLHYVILSPFISSNFVALVNRNRAVFTCVLGHHLVKCINLGYYVSRRVTSLSVTCFRLLRFEFVVGPRLSSVEFETVPSNNILADLGTKTLRIELE